MKTLLLPSGKEIEVTETFINVIDDIRSKDCDTCKSGLDYLLSELDKAE